MKKHKIQANKGDSIQVISGKYKGQTGIIKGIIEAKNKVTVEKINIKTKHIKPKQSEDKGSIVQIEGPIHYSNIKILKTDKK
uniref:Large ribosomal subunit protein uL24c n=1 Tax=Chondria sp. (in: red algae) TaxID=1982705 RepID=A0A1Z1MCF6_9FLOR|nr:ribosomal protein L24 [Chondria sp. (in: red algae)]